MHESEGNLVRSYFMQRLELGEKVIFRPFDMEIPEQDTMEQTVFSIDEFDKTENNVCW